jgi:hypothetical protein
MAVKKTDLWDPEFGLINRWMYPPTSQPRSRLRPTLLDLCIVLIIIGILVALLAPSLIMKDRDYSPVLPPKSERAIEPEIANIAGEYYQGDGLGMNWSLELTKDGRYSFVWSGCLGVYEKDCGYVRLVKGIVHLSPSKPGPEPRPAGKPWLSQIPTGLRIVRWGTRIYLVPDEEARDFCEAISEGREPRTKYRGRFFLSDVPSEVDLEKPVEGLPDVPESWKAMMPVRPKIEVEDPLPRVD